MPITLSDMRKSNQVMCLINKARDGASHLVWSTSKRDVKCNGQGNSGRNKLTCWVNTSSSVGEKSVWWGETKVKISQGAILFVCLFAKDTLAVAIYYSSWYARNYARRHKSVSTASLDFLNLSFTHLLNLSSRSREMTILSEWTMR